MTAADPRGRERGQVIVLVALAIVAVIVFAGLTLDGGVAFINRRATQNMSDIGALAGTKVVADFQLAGQTGKTGVDVMAAIDKSVNANGCAGPGQTAPCTWSASYIRPGPNQGDPEVDLSPVNLGSIPNAAQGVAVTVTATPGTYFVRVLGQTSWTVTTNATAIVAVPYQIPPGIVLPIGIYPPNTQFVGGQVIKFTSGGLAAPGQFGFLSWNGDGSTGTLANSLCSPDNPLIAFPAWLPGNTGVSNASDVITCLQKWLSFGVTVLVPTWDQVSGTGSNAQFHLTGLAAVVITGFDNPGIKSISARFVAYYPLPSVPAGYGRAPLPGDTSFFIGLIR